MHVPSPPPPRPPTPSGFIVSQQQGQIKSQQGHLNLDILPQVQGQCSNMLLQPLHQYSSQGQVQVQRIQDNLLSHLSNWNKKNKVLFHNNVVIYKLVMRHYNQFTGQQLSQGHVQVPGQQQPYENLIEQQGQ